ncbi:hypothetical protein TrVE_jg11520 [Triparma verrucosa]|uniref:U2A'/phosphoprotein 32 family A C-terminal domain-containing protein n=1 Tax=Triparma verrucosa TaxID=1606542 RepID=A0A9W7F5H6_9STRA|nr:hypothetical protein TrVE_jg11520 [Triparma verrucosa]|mmetsp:Transcript_21777/g.40974  ORF Transcript_21777/g.40974 Transcript_21777/m.40974 type:complete len:189 (-) Transcript_21777:87-653(-)|eukprot:CAMPEP_0182518642 /NCGR_PEP_ID=MMETSP1321-20130603/44682_1 /TAXON_ID=91990 /ORGANISM="Bolidomonas sp., Strain RCC1657" /LENGTH=188 /DNA_ID=CAMNT_0024726581 /DNA_START=207 /DNA_END=773 /DNA_ORIENTATION=-
MPGIPPVLTQAQVVDYSFMEIKNLKELVDSDSPEETGKAQEIVKLKGMTSLRISSNEIDDLENFHKYIDMVIENATDLQWLDLSYNKIPRIGLTMEPFKNVSVLYLQANNISKFGDLKALANLPSLTNLALHGNPVAAKKHYRNYVVHLLPRLHKLDFSCITKKERVRSQTWAQIFRKKLKGKKEDDE